LEEGKRLDLLDFSVNVNPDGPPESVVEALRAGLEDVRMLTMYPDLEEVALRGAIARHVGLEMERVVVGNGFVPLLEATVRALGVRSCLLPVPAFGEYRRVLELAGIAVGGYQLSAEQGFRYEPEALIRAAVVGGHDAVLLANPQNPSGVVCEAGGMLRLLELAEAAGVRILLDEAFIDYVREQSVVGEVERFAGLVVFRSVTKFYAIPGLRVAYCVGASAPRIAERCAPWAVSSLAAVGVVAALGDVAYAERTWERNRDRRERLATRLRGLGIHVTAGAANFLLLEVRGANQVWERMIVEYGIVLRTCVTFEGLGGAHLRVAVRTEPENEALVRGLAGVLGGAEC
jgi:threonine-phosphate decarboxylase